MRERERQCCLSSSEFVRRFGSIRAEAHERLSLALDQGTTGTTVLALERRDLRSEGAKEPVEVPQHFPAAGQVEHDAEEIWAGVLVAIQGALEATGLPDAGARVRAIGITNQRETTVLWDRPHGATGASRDRVARPTHRADVQEKLRDRASSRLCSTRPGCCSIPLFFGTKLRWLLNNVSDAQVRADRGELAFGTIDTWLVHKLSGGAAHVTDVTNASRTLLMDLRTLAWDDALLAALGIPSEVLPTIAGSAEVVAHTKGVAGLPDGIAIAGIAGDQQAALSGEAASRRAT